MWGEMKNSIEKRVAHVIAGLVTVGSIATCGYIVANHSKKWIDNRIKESITQYEQRDKQWTRKNFDARVPLEQLAEASKSTYQVLNEPHYKISEDQTIPLPEINRTGSGILFKGNYLLTAKHVVDIHFPHSHGSATYDHNELFLTNRVSSRTIKLGKLEKILTGERLDYALLKVNSHKVLSVYPYGFNIPKDVKPGMQSVIIGFPVSSGRNIRLGNVSQVWSELGVHHLIFKNNLIPGDSGGPLFVIENGDLKLVAISEGAKAVRDRVNPHVYHPININGGVKVSYVLHDIKDQLRSGRLDEKTAEEVKNFLKSNKPKK